LFLLGTKEAKRGMDHALQKVDIHWITSLVMDYSRDFFFLAQADGVQMLTVITEDLDNYCDSSKWLCIICSMYAADKVVTYLEGRNSNLYHDYGLLIPNPNIV